MWRAASDVIADPLPESPEMKLAAAAQKQAAQGFLDTWRPILMPEDADGD